MFCTALPCCGVVWCGVVWCGVVWCCGVVWFEVSFVLLIRNYIYRSEEINIGVFCKRNVPLVSSKRHKGTIANEGRIKF